MNEKIPGMDDVEKIRAFLNMKEDQLGIPEMQRMSAVLIGMLERHFTMQQSMNMPLMKRRRNGQGEILTTYADSPVRTILFKRNKNSMPSQESVSGKDLQVYLTIYPNTGKYSVALTFIPSQKDTPLYKAESVEFDQILPTIDDFLNQVALSDGAGSA